MKVRKIGKKLFYYVLLLAVVFNTSLSVPLFAKTRIPDEYKYAENNIIFYNSEGESSDNCTCYQSYGAIKSSDILLIGDEITRVSESEIKRLLPDITIRYIDNNDDNPYTSALRVLNEHDNFDKKGKIVIAVGTNKEVNRPDIEDIIKKVDSRILVLTTNLSTNNDDNNSYNNQNNKNMKNAAEYLANVLIADWANEAKNTDAYFNSDNSTKPTGNGITLYAQTIFNVLSEEASKINVAANVLYNGEKILSTDEFNKVTKNRKTYEDVAKKYDDNIPWQVFAAINYRENNFSEIKKSHLEEIGNNIEANYMSGVNLKSADGIKQLFHNYSGISESYSANARDLGFSENAGLIGEASPYVMNLADENRDSRNNSEWEAIINKGSNPEREKTLRGAFLVYALLGGSANEDCYCAKRTSTTGGGNNKDIYIPGISETNRLINNIAFKLSWPNSPESVWNNSKQKPTQAYYDAIISTGLSTKPNSYGKSCDHFVATVFRYSGIDPNFPCCGVSGHGSVWQYVTKNKNFKNIPKGSGENFFVNAQPGDILIKTTTYENGEKSSGHIMIYVQDENGQYFRADASTCDLEKNPEDCRHAAITGIAWDKINPYSIYRWVGN